MKVAFPKFLSILVLLFSFEHWAIEQITLVLPATAVKTLVLIMALQQNSNYVTTFVTIVTTHDGFETALQINTSAPWNWRAWWGRRQLCPTCQAGWLHTQQSQLLFHFHFLLLSAWSGWSLWLGVSQMSCWEVCWTGTNRPLPSWTVLVSSILFTSPTSHFLILVKAGGFVWYFLQA